MKLFDQKDCVKIVLEPMADDAVRLAASDLQRNLQSLSEQAHMFSIVNGCTDTPVIQVQTKDKGELESYEVYVEDEKVVITGADTLGTVYGIYAFATKCLGILPAYRFIDVFPEKKKSLELEPQTFGSAKRQVRFRGWFINDEDLLSDFKVGGGKRNIDYPFYQNVMAPEVLDMVLEMALRLEINLIIPASFLNIDNPDEEALVRAVCRRGLYVSQHHVEPMGVSYFSADSYIQKHGEEGEIVSFISNRPRMEEIWRYYAKKWAVYKKQVIWQLGLRGKADVAVWETDSSVPMSMEARGRIISDAIQTQYDIISEVLGEKNFYSTATLWNEGSGLYEEGYVKLPESTIIIFSDFGTDQMLGEDLYTTIKEEERHCGIYYHAAYWTLGSHLTEGCNPRKMAYNYQNAARQNKLYYSILNVSNVRPLHFSVCMNARIMENPKKVNIQEEMMEFDRAVFGNAVEEIHVLRETYYDAFADFGEEALMRKAKKLYFSYRHYENLPFLRNPATDGQLSWYGKKILLGMPFSDRPDPKKDLHSMKESVKKFRELYRKMEEMEGKLPENASSYFRKFLKYQTRHMQLLTEWGIACEALADESTDWHERKKQGEYGCKCLEQILEERKVLEEGQWEHWHRGDKKINIPAFLEMTRNYISEREKTEAV